MLGNRPGTAATTILAELRSAPIGALERHRGKYPGLVATFQATWDALPGTGQRALLTMAACANGTRTDIVAAVGGIADAGGVLDDLTVRSLVTCTPTSTTPWSLHDVVRIFVADQPGFAELAAAHHAWIVTHLSEHADPLKHREFAIGAAEVTHALLRCIEVGDAEQAKAVYMPLRLHLLQVGQLSSLHFVAQALLGSCQEETGIASMCMTDLGNFYRRMGDIQRSISYHERSLAMDVKLDRLAGQAACLCNLGTCYQTLGEIPKAIDYHERSLAIDEKLGQLEGQARQLGNLGLCYQDQGEMPRAIEYHERSLAIEVKLGQLEGQARQFGNLGLCYREQGEIPKALEYHERSLAIEVKLGQLEGQAAEFSNLGICYQVQGEIPRALEYHERSLAIEVKLGRIEGQATSLANLGECHESLGDVSRARDLLRRSLTLFHRMGLSDEHPTVRYVHAALVRLG